MNKAKVVALVPLIFASIQIAGWATAAEVRPKVARVVYITASGVCDCAQEICQRGDRVIAQIFVRERKNLLRIIDLARDARSADSYVVKLNLAFQVPAVLFVDAQDRILWHTGGAFSKEAILKKLGEFGI